MGRVLRAVDLLSQETVALKILASNEPELIARFKGEFLLLKKLHHPNIVQAFDFGFTEKCEPYFSMEYVPACRWEEFLFPPDHSRLYLLLLQILSTLDFLHSKKIIHGDIKPSNILITALPDGQVQVKFTDFGLAEYEKVEDPSRWKGTLPYLAPEIIRGEKYTMQADLYSVGVLLYESLFGKPPFNDDDPMDLAKSHLEKDVVIPESDSLSKELRDLILKLLEKDPMDRFFSAREAADQIQSITGIKLDQPENLLSKSLIRSAEFVGREKELSALKDSLAQAGSKGLQFILISGESGIGKTRLVEEFSARSQVEGFISLTVPVKDIRSMQDFKARFLPHLAGNSQPKVLIFEHLEQADDSFFEFLSEFASHLQGDNFLVCFTLINEITGHEDSRRIVDWENKIHLSSGDSLVSMNLNDLTGDETGKLLGLMFDWKGGTEKLSALIHETTGGNPWLIGQIMDSAAETGSIFRSEDKWSLKPQSIEENPIPQRVKEKIARRTASLNPDSMELLDYASVWEREIELENLMQMTGYNEMSLTSRLNDALSHGLVMPAFSADKREVRFVNNLFRRYIYDRIDPERRKKLHQKAGEILEKWSHSNPEEYFSQLATHFYRAGEVEPALKYSLSAAKRAEKESDHTEAIVQYTRVLEMLEQESSSSPLSPEEILEYLADQYGLVGESEMSLILYQKALGIGEAKDSGNRRPARLYKKAGKICGKMALHEQAVKYLEKSLECSGMTSPSGEHAITLMELGWVYLRESKYQKARDKFDEASNILKTETASWEKGTVFSALGSLYMTLGNYLKANQFYNEGLKVFIQLGNRQKIADSYGNLAAIARIRGDIKEAIEYFQKCLDLQVSLGDQYRLSIVFINLGTVYLDSNSWDKALEYLQKAYELQQRTADPVGFAFIHNNMGLIYLRRGELSLALEYFNRAIVQFRTGRYKGGVALVYFNLGDLYAKREEFDQAMWYLNKSLKIRQELGEEAGIADSQAILGNVFIQLSDYDRAKTYLLEALSRYRKQANRKAEAEVRLSLAELSVSIGDLNQAEIHLKPVQEFLQQNDIKFLGATFQRIQAGLMKARKDYRNSLLLLSASAKTSRELQAKLELGRTYLETGRIKMELGRFKEAKGFLAEALNAFKKAEVRPKIKEVESVLEQIKDLKILENERIGTFYQLAELLNNIWDTDELLTQALELIIKLLNAERGAIIFYSDKDRSFEVKIAQGIEKETSRDAIAISRQVLKDVIKGDTPLIVEDARKDSRFAKRQSVITYNILSILCVPLKTKNRLIGTVYLDHRSLPAIFSSEDVDFLKAFANLIATAIEKSELYVQANEEIFQLKETLHIIYEHPGIIGTSNKMQEVFNIVEKVAYSKASILILGENGTGKELIANLIHSKSPRSDGPFIKVNCAALPETLLESELFGIEDRTATGVGFRKGKFELADGGTIFLDEIGDMNLSVQAKVLRVMQEKEFERVGGQKTISVDIRVISATNMDLEKKIEERSFRKDLYFRLNPIVINIPPLRERKEDIPLLIYYFLEKHSRENNKPPIKFSKRTIELLKDYSWPGNVRELEHLMESSILLSDDGSFPERLLPREVMKTKSMVNLDRYGKLQEVLRWVEKKKILKTLDKNEWNQSRAAKELGITEPTLRRRIKRYKIKKTTKISSS